MAEANPMRPLQAHISREPYTEPTLRKLTREQATLFLVGYAYIGHQGARDILEVLFPAPNAETKVGLIQRTGERSRGRAEKPLR
jgi:hypothetical protein